MIYVILYEGTAVINIKRIVFETEDSKINGIQLKDCPEIILLDNAVLIEKEKGKSPILSNLNTLLFYISYPRVKNNFHG